MARITLKTREQIEKMRAAGRVVHQVLEACSRMCHPGVTTGEIDQEANRLILSKGARGLFKDYVIPGIPTPFPSHLCISINEVVVHGIAGDRKIQDGDVVSLDCGVMLDGWCGDSATTVLVGDVKPAVRNLCDVTRHTLDLAIQNIRPGKRWSQVARVMQQYAESSGVSVVRDYVGHGIGQKMHEEPKVPNFVSREIMRHDVELREGMVLAVEPMCNLGGCEVKTLADGWTVVTVDGLPAAHYEHTVAVTARGAEALTDGN